MFPSLTDQIESLTRGVRRLAQREAICWALAIVLGVALALMSIDYAFRLTDPGLRWLFTTTLATFIGLVGYRHYRFRGDREADSLEVARRVERRFPQLGSRLASALEFVDQPIEDPVAGSADLRRAVVVDTTTTVNDIPIEEILNCRPYHRALRVALICFAIGGAFGLFDPVGIQTALARLLFPWSDTAWPRQHVLQVTEAPERLARGQTFEATIVDLEGRLPDDLRMLYRTRVGKETRIERQPLRPGVAQAAAHRENVQRSFAFRTVGGDDNTMPWREVEVVDPPQLGSMQATATPPAYANLSPQDLGESARVLSGSRIAIESLTEEPIESALLEVVSVEERAELPGDVHRENEQGDGRTRITISREPWVVQTEATPSRIAYRILATNAQGLVGSTDRQMLLVEPDPAPSVKWRNSETEIAVTSDALLPIQALVEDNLAIAAVDLLWRPTEESEDSPFQRFLLHKGPTDPPHRDEAGWESPGESIETSKTFDLSDLDLQPGAQLTLLIEATDYRPGVGQSDTPRRVTIVSEEEFDALLAESQSDLLRDLQRLLGLQRKARQGAGNLHIERNNDVPFDQPMLDRLAAIGFEQRQIHEGVVAPRRGVIASAERILERLNENRLDRPELESQLRHLRDELRRLGDTSLPQASRAIANTRLEGQIGRESDDQESAKRADDALTQALANQDEVIRSIESLIEQMSAWADYQRFAQQIAELEQAQRNLLAETTQEAARAVIDNRSKAEEIAAKEKLATAQKEIQRQFDKLLQSMRSRAEDAASSDEAQTLRDALSEANDRMTTGKLDQATRRLQEGQLGRATEQQARGAEDMREMLDILRNRPSSNDQRLVEQLKEAQKQLQRLRQDFEKQRQKPAEARQSQDQQRLGEQAKRLGRRLDRLNAPQAGGHSQQGGGQMAESAQQQDQRQEESMRKAEEELQKAEERLAERIRQLENQIAQKTLDRLAVKMKAFAAAQRAILDQTVRLDQQAESSFEEIVDPDAIQATAELQRAVQEEVEEAAVEVAAREAFELALNDATHEMDQAAWLLEAANVGRQTQRSELAALQRLERIVEALEIDAPDQPADGGNGGNGGSTGDGQQEPTVDIAELKMLRLMQMELNAKTRAFEADSSEQELSPNAARTKAERLAERQQRLAELVEELVERNSGQQPPTPRPGAEPDAIY